MVSLINKQLLLTAYAYLFIMEQQKARQGSEALQIKGSECCGMSKEVDAAEDEKLCLIRTWMGLTKKSKLPEDYPKSGVEAQIKFLSDSIAEASAEIEYPKAKKAIEEILADCPELASKAGEVWADFAKLNYRKKRTGDLKVVFQDADGACFWNSLAHVMRKKGISPCTVEGLKDAVYSEMSVERKSETVGEGPYKTFLCDNFSSTGEIGEALQEKNRWIDDEIIPRVSEILGIHLRIWGVKDDGTLEIRGAGLEKADYNATAAVEVNLLYCNAENRLLSDGLNHYDVISGGGTIKGTKLSTLLPAHEQFPSLSASLNFVKELEVRAQVANIYSNPSYDAAERKIELDKPSEKDLHAFQKAVAENVARKFDEMVVTIGGWVSQANEKTKVAKDQKLSSQIIAKLMPRSASSPLNKRINALTIPGLVFKDLLVWFTDESWSKSQPYHSGEIVVALDRLRAYILEGVPHFLAKPGPGFLGIIAQKVNGDDAFFKAHADPEVQKAYKSCIDELRACMEKRVVEAFEAKIGEKVKAAPKQKKMVGAQHELGDNFDFVAKLRDLLKKLRGEDAHRPEDLEDLLKKLLAGRCRSWWDGAEFLVTFLSDAGDGVFKQPQLTINFMSPAMWEEHRVLKISLSVVGDLEAVFPAVKPKATEKKWKSSQIDGRIYINQLVPVGEK